MEGGLFRGCFAKTFVSEQRRGAQATVFSTFDRLLSRRSCSHVAVRAVVSHTGVKQDAFCSRFRAGSSLLGTVYARLFQRVVSNIVGRSLPTSRRGTPNIPSPIFYRVLRRVGDGSCRVGSLLVSRDDSVFLGCFESDLHDLVDVCVLRSPSRREESVPRRFLLGRVANDFIRVIR